MEQKEHQMMEMMQDSTMRIMMMDRMADNVEMRKQMMQGSGMDEESSGMNGHGNH